MESFLDQFIAFLSYNHPFLDGLGSGLIIALAVAFFYERSKLRKIIAMQEQELEQLRQ